MLVCGVPPPVSPVLSSPEQQQSRARASRLPNNDHPVDPDRYNGITAVQR